MTEPLRILHVFRAPVGGLFRHVVDVARAQAERGHAVGIFCDSRTGGARAAEALEGLGPLLALGVTRTPMWRNPHPMDALALGSLARACHGLRPDVLHGHGSKGGAYARALPGPLGTRRPIRVYTPHGGSFNYAPGSLLHRVYMGVERLLARRTDIFLFESDYAAGRFKAHVGETDSLVRVVQNGLGDSEFAPLTRGGDPFDLVYVGEMRAAKGVDTLIDALALLRTEGQRLTLLAVGSGPSEAELHARAKAHGLWDSIAFVPPRPIREALGQARVMVVPSKAESLPYVILEAAAAAQPLVSTDVGDIGQIFGPFADELIPPGNPRRLADAIRRKLREPADAREAKAHELAEHVRCRFSLTRMVDGVLEGYAAARRRRFGAASPELVSEAAE